MVICPERGASDLRMVQLMPLPPPCLCFSKTRNFFYWIAQVFLEKGHLTSIVVVKAIFRQSFKFFLKCLIVSNCNWYSHAVSFFGLFCNGHQILICYSVISVHDTRPVLTLSVFLSPFQLIAAYTVSQNMCI